MSGHTSGPWAVHKLFSSYVVPADHASRPVGGASNSDDDLKNFAQEIAVTSYSARHRSKDEIMANARLIAAAPDLLAALVDLYSLIHDMGWTTPDDRYVSITRAATAIAKATGETS